ncbi:tetratricopeptide repeat protein [Glacieibacterium sp.]|uniref:tetratricopeptide repeat protein n=1 Tax=Glacieibacterium sp. TaxID=2860237 RepID=UPI003AFFB3B8
MINDMRQSGRTHAALAHLDAFDLQYPRSNDAAVMRADCLVDIKAFVEAATIYRKLLKTETAAAAYAGLGRIEGLNDRWAGAVSEFGQAVARAPTSSTYLNDYGYALLKAGNLEQALFRTRQAAELAPTDVRARNNLILALSATGDAAGAAALLAAITDPVERADVRAAIAAAATTTAASATPGALGTRPAQMVVDPFAQ